VTSIEDLLVALLGLVECSRRDHGESLDVREKRFAVWPSAHAPTREHPRPPVLGCLVSQMPVLAQLPGDPVFQWSRPPILGSERVHREPGKLNAALGVEAASASLDVGIVAVAHARIWPLPHESGYLCERVEFWDDRHTQ
jgi:hypothetical protein